LRILVTHSNLQNWTDIANKLNRIFNTRHRTGKQSRERWHNHLNPDIVKENWTEVEEQALFSKHMEFGNKWSDIAKFLPGRLNIFELGLIIRLRITSIVD
jgi:hypothetical protein